MAGSGADRVPRLRPLALSPAPGVAPQNGSSVAQVSEMSGNYMFSRTSIQKL